MDNQEETDKFLERYYLPRMNQEKIENMNRPMKLRAASLKKVNKINKTLVRLTEKKKESGPK